MQAAGVSVFWQPAACHGKWKYGSGKYEWNRGKI